VTVTTSEIPLANDTIEGVRRVAAIAAEHAAESEDQRSLAQPVVDAMVACGLARLIAPTELGGFGDHPAAIVEVIAAIAAADPSAGWCAAIGIGTNHLAGYLPEAGARSLFTNLDRPGCAVFAPTGRGVKTTSGFRVTGRWPFASGCQHAALQASGILVVDEHGQPERGQDGAPLQRLAFMALRSLNIDETWDTVGLRGTGSHDTTAVDVAVEADHTMHFGDRSWSSDAIFRQPVFGILASCLASVPLGVGRAALDAVEHQAQNDLATPPRPGPRPRFADDPYSQQDLGRAEVRLRAARSLLLDVLDEGYQLGVAGDSPSREHTALLGLTCGEAMAASAHAVDVACRISGSGAVRQGAPLEKARRDIDTMRKHVLFSPGVEQPLGRQIAGVPTIAWPFLTRPL
jgi:indole-3-acetate monooxygenase